MLIAVTLFFVWAANNANNNLTARGDSFGFGFLNNPAGFQILPTLGTAIIGYEAGETTDFEVFFHALKFLKKKFNYNPDYVVNLRPTSPIRKKNTLDVAIDKFINSNKYDSIRSVCLNEKTPYKMWFIKNNNLSPIINSKKIKEAFNLPRQLLPNT